MNYHKRREEERAKEELRWFVEALAFVGAIVLATALFVTPCLMSDACSTKLLHDGWGKRVEVQCQRAIAKATGEDR